MQDMNMIGIVGVVVLPYGILNQLGGDINVEALLSTTKEIICNKKAKYNSATYGQFLQAEARMKSR